MRLNARFAILPVVFASPILAASCMAPPGGPTDDLAAPVATAPSEIINGSIDNTHTAVVAVLAQDFSCTGTIIKVNGSTGYVLTAAHCCPPGDHPTQICVGPDYAGNCSPHTVIGSSVQQDNCYDDCAGSTDDVCVLKFSNANGLPSIPVLTPSNDSLAVGQNLTYVGYGLKGSPGAGGSNNTARRTVTKPIGTLDPYFVGYANPAASGTCEGDSGGPGLVTIGGQEYVAAVTSYGDQACTMLGVSIRTSSTYTKVIEPFLNDQTQLSGTCPIESDCNTCFSDAVNSQCQHGSCGDELNNCLKDAQCNALINCVDNCTDSGCQKTCNTNNLGGLQTYEKLQSCLCNTACTTACGPSQFCTANHCGTKPSGASAQCKQCAEDNCCTQAFKCFESSACIKCFTNNPGADCPTNQDAIDYFQCVNSNCGPSVCNLKDPTMGSMTTSSTTSDTTTSTGSSTGGAGGAGGASGTTDATSSTGSTNPPVTTTTSCACRDASSGDVPAWPLAGLVAGVAAVVTRRRRGR